MKALLHLLVACGTVFAAPIQAQSTQHPPENLTMSLAWVADAGESDRYVFVINGALAFQSVEELKAYLADLPPGSTLTWAPSCVRRGGEPLLDSDDEMKEFEKVCATAGINLVIVPSG